MSLQNPDVPCLSKILGSEKASFHGLGWSRRPPAPCRPPDTGCLKSERPPRHDAAQAALCSTRPMTRRVQGTKPEAPMFVHIEAQRRQHHPHLWMSPPRRTSGPLFPPAVARPLPDPSQMHAKPGNQAASPATTPGTPAGRGRGAGRTGRGTAKEPRPPVRCRGGAKAKQIASGGRPENA